MQSNTTAVLSLAGIGLAVSYLCAWAESTMDEIAFGRTIKRAENPSGSLFWWIK